MGIILLEKNILYDEGPQKYAFKKQRYLIFASCKLITFKSNHLWITTNRRFVQR